MSGWRINIQNFKDAAGTIENMGIDNVEQIRKNAQIAKANAQRDISIATANAQQEANAVKVAAEKKIAEQNAELAVQQADMKVRADTKKAEEIVARAITLAEKEIPGIRASYVITGSRPYIERDDASPLLSLLRRTCGDVTGTEAVVSYFPGYTDTAVIAGTLHNHNCMSYGPGNLECAHQPDEWVSLDDISRCEAVYRRLALET